MDTQLRFDKVDKKIIIVHNMNMQRITINIPDLRIFLQKSCSIDFVGEIESFFRPGVRKKRLMKFNANPKVGNSAVILKLTPLFDDWF